MNLEDIRRRIDGIDEQLSALLEERLTIVRDVAAYKLQNNMPILDAERERRVVERALSRLEDDSLAPYVEETYRHIMGASRHMQSDMLKLNAGAAAKPAGPQSGRAPRLTGYMGVPGSFSEQSVMDYWGLDCERKGYPLFADVIDALLADQIDSALLPIENSSTGSVNEVVDLIREKDVYITGEQIVRVRHFLLGLPSADLGSVKGVYSHPQALEQCAGFLRSHGLMAMTSLNTAVAAQQVARSGNTGIAAISSARAAGLYGLKVLAADIQDHDFNYTRFVALSRENLIPEGADKVSIVFALNHRPGTLYAALQYFAEAGVNLTNLESRPIWSQAWHYFFHLDFTGKLEDAHVQNAIAKLKANCSYLKVLGNYRAASLEELA